MMLKTFFLSQVAHAIGLPENVPGDILYSTDAGVTGMAPPSENILRRSADRHRIERKIVGRLLKGSNRGDPYQRAVEKSTWGKVAVVGTPMVSLIELCLYLFGLSLPDNTLFNIVHKGFNVIEVVFILTTLTFALLHATGWFRVNAAITVGAFITFVGLAISMWTQLYELMKDSYAYLINQTPGNLAKRKKTYDATIGSTRILYTLYAWALTGLVWLIAYFAHTIRGAWIPAYRLLF